MARYFLDTNILISNPHALMNFQEHHVYISMRVTKELDGLKGSTRSCAVDARHAIRVIESIIKDASHEGIQSGINLPNGYDGKLSIVPDAILSDDSRADDVIIATVLEQQEKLGDIVLVTNDIHMRLQAKASGVEQVESFRTDNIESEEVIEGKGYLKLSGDIWDYFESTSTIHADLEQVYDVCLDPCMHDCLSSIHPGMYILGESDAVARVIECDGKSMKFVLKNKVSLMKADVFGITPQSFQQALAIDALLDPSIDIVIITGAAGTGKTLLTCAASLEQSFSTKRYSQVIVTRSAVDIERIGYLPGNESVKMSSYMAGFEDSLDFLVEQDVSPHSSKNYIKDKCMVTYKSLNYLRGASISNSFIVCDEMQNTTRNKAKAVLTRVSKDSKMVVMGNLDPSQIDDDYITPMNSGLSRIVEIYAQYSNAVHIQLEGTLRGSVAEIAEREL
ncbi:PhoH family protein [Vibrio maritimus]|uniref:PhoH family protein n=1 Tax=Vibrio maritimus TaxID=990268 RepID=UPI00406815A0